MFPSNQSMRQMCGIPFNADYFGTCWKGYDGKQENFLHYIYTSGSIYFLKDQEIPS